MTRIDSVRAATESAKDSVLHAADVVAPYAGTARDRTAHYARAARVRLAPVAARTARTARVQYAMRLAPHVQQVRVQARAHVPPMVDEAAVRTGKATRRAVEVTRPRIEQAVAAAGPLSREAASRSSATLAALRGEVSAHEVQHLIRRRERRARAIRVTQRTVLLGALVGGAFLAWKWWERQANPDWLVEPPAATEVPDESRLGAVDGTDGHPSRNADVRARQAEARSAEHVSGGRRGARHKGK